MEQECPFCNIASQGDRVLKEAEYMYVIFSNPRLMPGHLLVIPKRHVMLLAQLSEEERKELIDLVIEFEQKILERISSGCDIRQHHKPYIENSRIHVNHLHVHLHPREVNDELHQVIDPHREPLYRSLPDDEKEHMRKLLKE